MSQILRFTSESLQVLKEIYWDISLNSNGIFWSDPSKQRHYLKYICYFFHSWPHFCMTISKTLCEVIFILFCFFLMSIHCHCHIWHFDIMSETSFILFFIFHFLSHMWCSTLVIRLSRSLCNVLLFVSLSLVLLMQMLPVWLAIHLLIQEERGWCKNLRSPTVL